jgi:hypothetical protein
MSDIYGPNTARIERFLERLRAMTDEESIRWSAAAREAEANSAATESDWKQAWDAIVSSGLKTEFEAARSAARAAYPPEKNVYIADHFEGEFQSGTIAGIMVVRDLISPAVYAALVAPFVAAGFGRWVGVLSGEEEWRLAAEIRTFYGTGPEAQAAFDLAKAEILE